MMWFEKASLLGLLHGFRMTGVMKLKSDSDCVMEHTGGSKIWVDPLD